MTSQPQPQAFTGLKSIDWLKLDAITREPSSPNKPCIAFFHGTGQYIRSPNFISKLTSRWEYWHFPTMSGVVEECERRGFGCFMPQGPFRNWRPWEDSEDPQLLAAAIRFRTSASGKLFLAGLSDGGTLVNIMSFRKDEPWSGYVSYSGVFRDSWEGSPDLEFPTSKPFLICSNKFESGMTAEGSENLYRRFREAGKADVEKIVFNEDRHEWSIRSNRRIFDWIQKVAEN